MFHFQSAKTCEICGYSPSLLNLKSFENLEQRFQRQADDVGETAGDSGNENAPGSLDGVAPRFAARFAGANVPFQMFVHIGNKRHFSGDDSLGSLPVRSAD